MKMLKKFVASVATMALFAVAWLFALLFALTPSSVWATALVEARNTVEINGQFIEAVQGSNVIYAGSIVALNASGLAVPGSDASGLGVVGRAEVTSSNVGATYDSNTVIRIKRGVFRWDNGGSFTDADIGDFAYCLDDATVFTAAMATNDIVAGLIFDVDSDGVWVDTFSIGGRGAASVAALTASGAAVLQSTLTVTGISTLNSNAVIAGALSVAGTNITFSGLPTSTNGLTTGRLWNNSGALSIKP